MNVSIDKRETHGSWEVSMRVDLDRRETNDLFLAGDKLVSWPTDGLRPLTARPMERSSMFLSEIVARPDGLRLAYETEEIADRAAKILDYQVRNALGG